MMKSIGFTDCKWPNKHAEMTEDEPGIVLPLGGTNVNNYLFTPDIDSEKEQSCDHPWGKHECCDWLNYVVLRNQPGKTGQILNGINFHFRSFHCLRTASIPCNGILHFIDIGKH